MGTLVTTPLFGSIVSAAGGVYTSKPRPVLIFQNTALMTGESTVVVPFTSQNQPGASFRVPVKPTDANGLDRDCWLEIDKIGAIRTSWIGPVIGKLEGEPLYEATRLVRQLLNLER